MTMPTLLTRRNVLLGFLIIAVLALAMELGLTLPLVLETWHPYDFGLYLEMGNAARLGINPVGPRHYYPLPTVLWIFVPLSLLPDGFRLVWAIAPFVFILILHRRQAAWFVLFPPLWFNVTDAMLDGWLLLPLAWVAGNRPVLAGIGAVFLLIKPQLAIFVVAYVFLRWVLTRAWKNCIAFLIGTVIFCLPAFIFDPLWLFRLVDVLPQRAGESMAVFPLLTSSVWAWWWLGGFGVIIGVLILVGASGLAVLAFKRGGNPIAVAQALNQLLVPVLFAANLTTLLAVVNGRRQILALTGAALLAFTLDAGLSGFGGGYVLLPLVALYFQSKVGRNET